MDTADKRPLRPTEIRFARLVSTGSTYVEAYTRAFNTKGVKRDIIEKRASRLAHKPGVMDSAKQFLAELKLQDIDNANKCVMDLLADLAAAREAGNMTAVASLTKTRCQVHGLLKENVHVTAEQTLTDEQILDRLAGKDEHKRAMFKAVLGQGDDYSRA